METINWRNPLPTAEIPLLSGTRLQLAQALQDDRSYYEISLLFPSVIADAKDVPQYMWTDSNGNHVKILERMQDPRSKIWRIFHSIPREMLKSLVLGTVAHDFTRRVDRPETYREMRKWGIYVVSISVLDRDGKWLCANELGRVIRAIQRYFKAYRAWKVHLGKPVTPDHKKLHDFMLRIDNVYGRHDTAKEPRFVYKDESLPAWRDFVARLEHRMQASLTVDPDGTKHMVQAPLYVGCSVRLEDRSEQYDPARGNTNKLKSVSKSYVLLISIMSDLDIQPVHTCKCVLRL